MVKYHESVFYNSLDELQATYKPNHPDILRLEKKYGPGVSFGRISYPVGSEPKYELGCYTIIK
jgi:hypothetical protein